MHGLEIQLNNYILIRHFYYNKKNKKMETVHEAETYNKNAEKGGNDI